MFAPLGLFNNLTIRQSREMQVTLAIIDEMCTSEIGKNFRIKSNTVSTVKKNIFIKLNVKSDIVLYKLV